MNASRATRRPEPDQRLLVLLAVGLLLLLCPLLSRALFLSKSGEVLPPVVYVWLTGTEVPEGLYRITSEGWRRKAACCVPFKQLSAAAFRGEAALRPASFRIQAGTPPMPSTPPAELAPFFFAPIAVNQADRELLETLPGIGPRLADGIIGLRQQKKKFHQLDELLEVSGIGSKKLAKLKGLVSFDDPD
jgi:competence ComEA-like helix-hairpin-helix protein